LVGWLYGFRAQTGAVAYWSYATFVRRLGEAATPGEGSAGRVPTAGQQGSGPERYTEQGFEAPSQASGFPPRPYLQRGPPHPSLSPNVEALSSDLYP